MTDTAIALLGGDENDVELLFLGDRLDDVSHNVETFTDRERHRYRIQQSVTTARQIEKIGRKGVEGEHSAVHQQ